jgi:hypothetical protein
VVLAYALHHVVPVALDKDDRGLVSKLTLEMEGYDIVH